MASKMTPQQIEQGMDSLRNRVGYEMDKDDPMRSLAARTELAIQKMMDRLDRLTDKPEKAPSAPSASTTPDSADKA